MSAILKIGVERYKIGDILFDDEGADILTFEANSNYIVQGLSELTRFKKSSIKKIELEDIRIKKQNFEKFTIIVSSMRIDNIVSELASCSRSKSIELIENERVLINYDVIIKSAKILEYGDIVTIRGKGKFIIDGLVRNTRNERFVIEVSKYA